jgi:squalene synthase HpnC
MKRASITLRGEPQLDPLRLARAHYENFPVLSVFVPRDLRFALASVYAFARATDDIGDEGAAGPAERLAALARWEAHLDAALAARLAGSGFGCDRADRVVGLTAEADDGASHPVLVNAARTIHVHGLPVEPFRALIHANRLDQIRTRYSTYADLLEYCAYSANPVGRIVLRLFGKDDVNLLAPSDAICTGLQLANHLQHISEDLRLRNRLYIPLEDLDRFDVREVDLLGTTPTRAVRRLVGFLLERTRALLESGAGLPEAFDRRRAAVLRLFLRGGLAILDEIKAREDDLLRRAIQVPRRRAFLIVAGEALRCARR